MKYNSATKQSIPGERQQQSDVIFWCSILSEAKKNNSQKEKRHSEWQKVNIYMKIIWNRSKNLCDFSGVSK